ncbi:MAG: beta-ketoacyl-ACP synthase 3 [Bryobacteraceae bacterium]|jgi:3-oxoacyl-[acyl-carrier-protein] synthase-3
MAFLRAFGSYLPSRVAGNAELAALLGCDPDWILSVSGISERRYAAEDETVVDLAHRAGSDCLNRAGVEPGQIGLLIVSSGSAERRFPGPAAETAFRLGLNGIPAIDLPVASAGSVFALALAAQLSPVHGQILVIAAEKMSAVISRPPLDRNTAILFGDGAGACLVHPTDGPAEILDACLHTDGAFAQNLRLEFEQPIHMDGRTVILQASRKMPAVIREVLERKNQAAAGVDTYLMHQANQNLIVRVAEALGVDPPRFYSNIARYGNTSSASMLIAAAEWSAESGFRPSQPVVFAGFGAGFHWGALLAAGR